MRPATLLIALPLVVLVVLVQSHLWLPTYEDQTRATPERLTRFINSATGDAKLLNPILYSDAVSGQIIDFIFDGLLEYDENLALQGVLAKRWELGELASITVRSEAFFPDGRAVDADAIEERVLAYLARSAQTSDLVRSVHHEPAMTEEEEIDLPEEEASATLRIRQPARVVFELTRIDPDFFERLETVLGPNYDEPPAAELRDRFIEVEPARLRTPALASTSAPTEEDFETFRHRPTIDFELRKGVRFHDGHEFDAGDVIFTYDSIVDPTNLSPRSSNFEPVDRIERLDSHRLRVIYKRLFSPAILAWTIGILPEHILGDESVTAEKGGDEGADDPAKQAAQNERADTGMRERYFNKNPIGTGAYRFARWESDEDIHLVRNDDYYDGPSGFSHYHLRIIPDALTRELEFRTGALDVYSPQPHQVDRLLQDPTWRGFSYPGSGYSYIGWNTRKEIFRDPRVRRALGMAINIPEIIDYLLYGQGERTTGPYPKNTPWYDHEVPALPYDPKAALALLEEVGYRRADDGWLYKDGQRLEFNLVTNNGNDERKAILSVAQNAWAKIGVKANTRLFEWTVFLEDFINPRAFDAVILGWNLGIDHDLYDIWHSSQSEERKFNFVSYSNPKADALIAELRNSYDQEEQMRLAHALHRQIAQDQPYTFLYSPRTSVVLDRKIVMTEDGKTIPIRTTPHGRLFYYFDRWHKGGTGSELTP